jgi:hypothetical protein
MDAVQNIWKKLDDWIKHPTFATTIQPWQWLLGLLFIVILAFLWSRVVKQIVREV